MIGGLYRLPNSQIISISFKLKLIIFRKVKGSSRSLSGLGDRREHGGKARPVFLDFEAHSGSTQRKIEEKWTAFPPAQ